MSRKTRRTRSKSIRRSSRRSVRRTKRRDRRNTLRRKNKRSNRRSVRRTNRRNSVRRTNRRKSIRSVRRTKRKNEKYGGALRGFGRRAKNWAENWGTKSPRQQNLPAASTTTIPAPVPTPLVQGIRGREDALMQLNVGQLRQRAQADGVPEELIEEARDGIKPKEDLVALILRQTIANPPRQITNDTSSDAELARRLQAKMDLETGVVPVSVPPEGGNLQMNEQVFINTLNEIKTRIQELGEACMKNPPTEGAEDLRHTQGQRDTPSLTQAGHEGEQPITQEITPLSQETSSSDEDSEALSAEEAAKKAAEDSEALSAEEAANKAAAEEAANKAAEEEAAKKAAEEEAANKAAEEEAANKAAGENGGQTLPPIRNNP